MTKVSPTAQVAGVGVGMHSLPVTYLGYGLIGGVGIGIGYVVPIGGLLVRCRPPPLTCGAPPLKNTPVKTPFHPVI